MHFCALSQARHPLCPLPRVNDHKRPDLVGEITEKNLALQRLSIRLTVAQRIEPQIVVYLLMVLGLGTPASWRRVETHYRKRESGPGTRRHPGCRAPIPSKGTIDHVVTVHDEKPCTPCISRNTHPLLLKIFTSKLADVYMRYIQSDLFSLVYTRLPRPKSAKIHPF